MAISSVAHAATTVSYATDTGPDGSFTTTFNAANMPLDAMGMFTSALEFSTLAGILGIRVDTSASVPGGPNDTDITSVLLTGTGLGDGVLVPPADFSTDIDEIYRLFQFPVDPGNYVLTIQGFGAPQNSGFTGQIVFSNGQIPDPSAVPEPATWLMLMIGLGVIGFAMRRSRGEPARTNVRFNMA